MLNSIRAWILRRRRRSLWPTDRELIHEALQEPGYGFEIVKRVEAATNGDVLLGLASLYGAVFELFQAGEIRHYDDIVVDGVERRRYVAATRTSS